MTKPSNYAVINFLQNCTSEEWKKFRKAGYERSRYKINGVQQKRHENSVLDFTNSTLTGHFVDFDFGYIDFSGATFINCSFTNCKFSDSDVGHTKIQNSKFTNCYLGHCSFFRACFYKTKIINCYFGHTTLSEARIENTTIKESIFHNTIFYRTEFIGVKGLETSKYEGMNLFDTFSIPEWKNLPLNFVRGLGVPEFIINILNNPDKNAINFFSCFISYASTDYQFANKLYADLQSIGIRCWFAPEHLNIGDKIRRKIDESINIYDKLLIILSESSVNSHWVEHEVEAALEKEIERREAVLFPIRLDDCIQNIRQGWAAKIKRERNIGDFSNYKNESEYKRAFKKLVESLKNK